MSRVNLDGGRVWWSELACMRVVGGANLKTKLRFPKIEPVAKCLTRVALYTKGNRMCTILSWWPEVTILVKQVYSTMSSLTSQMAISTATHEKSTVVLGQAGGY